MTRYSRVIIYVLFVLTLVSCSIFTSKRRHVINEEEVTWLNVPSEDKKSKRKDETKEETTKQRPKIEPFTVEESAHVALPAFKNLLSFTDLEIDMPELVDEFHYPADGHLTSDYGLRNGRMHTGVDIKANRGDDIFAAFDGVVRFAKYYGGYGNTVVIRHYSGLETVYAHATKLLVKVNQEVKAGDVIAKAGRTGRATGDHLHFEVRVVGQTIDPKLILDTDKRCMVDKNLYITMKSGKIVASHKAKSN
ncbi:MAG: M23 family metallopeptidase [Rikenellaceae bacterium]